ncbi:conjugative relaxase [Roseobacter sp. HKCCD9010]|uniref:MobF family relaxase n=2 Tax=unclassified Roseobacter TaxID=196798 RepID=UPI0014923E35|nr:MULTISPECIES: MobF family relaxase [unclassified Roseobacter]MBF9052428.1 conjugative relaxase [Rhodobacterales bacterium HKCCD4356]NNV40894.1 conjugative relaxase [Roseobacter sp. HKCCD9054]NNV79210.1 conjugative relaxase [Roseobacter sp. HKCCD6135]NNW09001.1 conjugative relaxase [Roseobacter sp. HKCCD8431]NNW25868.1 conjugative relaxase [Roseobacter sp. HKCCD5929]NNW34507.1 conjugative relaxase [Roseobacter sp. HKCCD8198]NNW38791.1 conjugative relaxase [Roseobacter sp. HKCCD9117-2]NNW5
MLSMSNVSSGHASSGYYKAEGYYLEGSNDAEKSSQFYGKAAEEAGLTDSFSDDRFTAILDGQTPDGRTLGRYRDGEREHRPGIDLTFSAPKAVSIAALVGGDTRILKAHTDAVKTALDYAEANLVQTRRYVNGQVRTETGCKIIAGLFQHDTSRALDPQLHTHAVIANMVKDSNGDFRSLSNEALYNGKMLLGQIYRSALAQNLQDLGYETKALDKGLFDIKGVPQELVDTFSKRREEIEQALKDKNYEPTAVASSLAALATRSAKQPVQRSELRAAWAAEVKSLNIDLQQTLREASRHQQPSFEAREKSAGDAVEFAIAHHSEREAVYAEKDLLMTAMKFAPGVTEKAAAAELKEWVKDRILYPVDLKEGRFYTDVENIRLETENKNLMRTRIGEAVLDLRTKMQVLAQRSSDSAIAKKLSETTLTAGQKDAVGMVLSATSYVTAVQGYAGTGKTYMLETALRMAQARGYEIEGLAPSHKAVTALNEALPVASTVESALVRHENGANLGDKSKTILAVDEASMLSSDSMNRVLKMASAQDYAKVVLIGDVKQLEAVGAGSAFRALQDAGMPTALMTDIQRQRTDEGRSVVLSAIAGDIKTAMAGVNQLTEVGAGKLADVRNEIATRMADTYMAMTPEQRAGTGLIVLTNALRKDVNEQIQGQLRDANLIGQDAVEVSSLVPRNFSQAEAREIGSYKVGDIVVAPVASSQSPMTANVLYTVTSIAREDQKLHLQSPDQQTITLSLAYGSTDAHKLAVFSADKQDFHVGDAVKFKITDREHGIFNSAEGYLKSVGRDRFTVVTKDGDELSIPTDSLAARGMQLAYASTAHDFQGSTVDRVLLGMSSTEQLTTQKSFYVALSRMRDTIHLVTDRVDKLASKIADETGERMNSLEALAAQRDEAKSGTKTPAKDRDEARQHERDIQVGKPDKKQPEKVPKDHDQDDKSKDAQMSFADRFIASMTQDQKQRDERSR